MLSENGAARLLDALDAVDQNTVARARTARAPVGVGFAGTERFDATRHDVTDFSCGNELLVNAH